MPALSHHPVSSQGPQRFVVSSSLAFGAAPLAAGFTAAWVSRAQGEALAVVREADGPQS
jgi:hypothetical protein